MDILAFIVKMASVIKQRIVWSLFVVLLSMGSFGTSWNFFVSSDIQVTVNCSKILGNFSHFWESTGLSPPEPYQKAEHFLLSKDMELNFALIGALPTDGTMQVRIHWVLNLITVTDAMQYNFTNLDQLVNMCRTNDLKLGFELMGNPSNYFQDFENKSQIYEWRNLIKSVAKRYIVKYGLNYVQSWNFESWNEPDHGDFNGLNFTVQGFLNYYDACSEGLRLAQPSLRLGGPAESFRGKFVRISWGLLEHCANGTNYFTGEQGVRLDFISMHQKGNRSSLTILDEELNVIAQIHSRLPSLKDVPIFNDEGDPLVGWWRPEEWRADNTYAAMAVKVIAQHQEHLLRPLKSIRFQLLSNDNGFLNDFPAFFLQRTLLARFQMNNSTPGSVQMIRKPIYSALGLLSLLGDREVDISLLPETEGKDVAEVGALATYHACGEHPSTRDRWNAGILFYNSADTNSSVSAKVNLTISVVNLTNVLTQCEGMNEGEKLTEFVYVWYKMDNIVTNPYKIWLQSGKPRFPTKKCFQRMRSQEEPRRLGKPRRIVDISDLKFQKSLSQPGILVLHICQKPPKPPGKVINVRLYRISETDFLITWRSTKVRTKCLLTYEVELFTNGSFHRLNLKDIIFHSYQHTFSPALQEDFSSGFRVRAVDYWQRPGEWSALEVL